MFKNINIGNEKATIRVLTIMQSNKKPENYDIRIHNSHIMKLNEVIGKKVFKKDALYIGSETLWEIMQDVGGRGKHHYHGLTPQDVYNALNSLKESNEISLSYDGRYLIVTVATIHDGANLAIIVAPNSSLIKNYNANIIKIITIYPYKKK